MMLAAQGQLAAIVQALGGRSSKAMAAYRKALGGGSAAAAGDSSEMAKLRDRIGDIRKVVNQGQR